MDARQHDDGRRPGTGVQTEQVVLVDPAGNAIGSHDKHTVHGADTPLHLGFSCYIFDDRDRLLVTRRSLHKRTFGGVWTNSVCGHPAPGETLRAAVMRRVRRELGLAIGLPRLVLADFSYYASMHSIAENELCPVLVAHALGSRPHLDPDEVADLQWEPWTRFASQVASGERIVSPWCREQVEALAGLGDSPDRWPNASPGLLPAAVRW
ncbi:MULTISPECIES: isopentenyl-diphosphate Delta-isomerase [Allobranchiibius]|uniref:Isopentenyl-diphosphate Delta-isomerase n=1 Tax=Allobranchiibius huperziae TaxID=1874116 RepID=A0A853DN80_9MICO|nr:MULTISPECIES: isopentenyl-diphosphate Delta-isomerase [Allobranchiibius]MBO1767178.1 isopentenyl-diphosphate Delta-isomerase [Allobranchiibius sp. GilTou38]NYJ76070.1 isopentenyl-diphosphate delta-isomerase [Allobranchiibius huperziae]